MTKFYFRSRKELRARLKEKPKCVHKKWVDLPTGARALFTDLLIVAQMSVIAFVYAVFAAMYPPFWFISMGFTLFAAIYVLVEERDAQSKVSWLILFALSFGAGYIVYILADKRVCYGIYRKRYAEIYGRTKAYSGGFFTEGASPAVARDCEYIHNAGGYVPYTGTDVKYFSDARKLFDNLCARLEEAKEFVFLEYFIVAEGVLLERLIDVLSRKVAEGVEVRFLYDDVGSQGVLTSETKHRIRKAGIKFKVFEPLFSLFYFGLNYRDHRKIIVIDGKTGYVGGCNIADECTNQRRMEGLWKDAGLRLDGSAVDGLTITFLRQWEFSTRQRSDLSGYLYKAEKTANTSNVVPYAGGPEIEEPLCRGVYYNLVNAAQEKIYLMTPYLIPDTDMLAALTAKAKAGCDVRIVLPSVPDYGYIYRVTKFYAERLMAAGAKVYYMHGVFVHSKVMLTENAVTVGSVNMDMRAFYLEFDNGVYTDDKGVMGDVEADFEKVFAANDIQTPAKHNIFGHIATTVLRVVSPLM